MGILFNEKVQGGAERVLLIGILFDESPRRG